MKNTYYHVYTCVQMRKHVDVQTASQMYSLDLPELGPYRVDYTRNGRHMLLGGSKGHVALIDSLRMDVVQELHLRESVRDVKVRLSCASFSM